MAQSDTKIADRVNFLQTVTGFKVVRQDIEFGLGRTRVFATNPIRARNGECRSEEITIELVYDNVIEYTND